MPQMRWHHAYHGGQVIDEPAVIRRILKHLRLWNLYPKQPDHPARAPPWPPGATIPLTYHPVPDIA